MRARSLTRAAAAVAMGLALFGPWLSCPAKAQEAQALPYYEYTFYLGRASEQDLAQKARTAAPAALAHHQLVDPHTLRRWDGRGKIPLAFEQRRIKRSTLQDSTNFDSGEPLTRVLGPTSHTDVQALAVMIGAPRERNVPAYIEALKLSVAVARAVDAKAFKDTETEELYETPNLVERLSWGMRDAKSPVSDTNAPRLTIMGGITTMDHVGLHGVRTLGMRKLGLPDLALPNWLPGQDPLWVVRAVANQLISGNARPVIGSKVSMRSADPEVGTELDGALRLGGEATVQLSKWTGASGRALQIDFPGAPGLHLYERQALFNHALVRPRFPTLSDAQERELSLAIARAKARAVDLRSSFPALRQAGTRVFVALDATAWLAAKDSLAPRHLWYQVIDWNEDGSLNLRPWDSDPRAGGAPLRYDPPLVTHRQTYEYVEIDATEGNIEDMLVLDKRQQATGAEVVALVRRWAVPSTRKARP